MAEVFTLPAPHATSGPAIVRAAKAAVVALDGSRTKTEALRLAKLGFRVFPVRTEGDKAKTPYVRWKTEAATHGRQIDVWWDRWPTAAIGIATGRLPDGRHLMVVDLDVKNEGINGIAAFRKLAGNNALPVTPHATTPSGGEHWYFLMPKGADIRNSVRTLGSGIDVRGEGGYVVAPPSVLTNGRYQWRASLKDAEIAPCPPWLATLLRAAPKQRPKPEATGEKLNSLRAGSRNNALTRMAGAMRNDGSKRATILRRLLSENEERCTPPLPDEEVKRIAASVCKYPTKIGAAEDDADRTLLTIRASDVDMEPVEWLWPRWLPRGMVTLLAGEAGIGKSTLLCRIAAHVTQATEWPDKGSPPSEPGSVLYLSAEDPIKSVLTPRLMAAGADLKRVRLVKGVSSPETPDADRPMNLEYDIAALERHLKSRKGTGVSLVIIDPITSYLGRTDSNSATEVRNILHRLSKLVEELRVACVLVTHQRKESSDTATQKILGSSAWVAVARMVWTVGTEKGEDADPTLVIIAKAKTNIAPMSGLLAYRVEECSVVDRRTGDPIETTRVRWDKAPDGLHADDLVRDGSAKKASQAEKFLLEELPLDGEGKLWAVLKERAQKRGLSEMTLRRARKSLPLEQEKRGDGKHYWKRVSRAEHQKGWEGAEGRDHKPYRPKGK